MKTEKIEDIERVAWYACLAFGVYPQKESTPPPAPEKGEPAYNVIP